MENEEVKVIPWIAHEAEMTRFERAYRRVWILCIIIFVALVLTNAGWILYESQFEDFVITQENGGAPNNFIGNDGDIYNGSDAFIKGALNDGETDDQIQTAEDGR